MDILLPPRLALNGIWLFAGAAAITVAALLFFLGKKTAALLLDRSRARALAAALISGEPLPAGKKRGARRFYGMGLPFKMSLLLIALVLLAVFLVAAPVFVWTAGTQRETLLGNLRDRAHIFLDGLAASTLILLDSDQDREAGRLLERSGALPEARFVTITVPDGRGERVLASNDPDIFRKIDTETLIPGVSLFRDVLSPRIGEISGEFATQDRPGWTEWLEAIDETGVLPLLAPSHSAETEHFLFYRPVISRDGEGQAIFAAMIRLEAGTELIALETGKRQKRLFRLLAVLAASALVLALADFLLFSLMIILPIRRLSRHVERIRDTENMIALDGVEISVKQGGEIAFLAHTINDMTRQLVRAARAARELTIGKELQKKFIPLDTAEGGGKLTTGSHETPRARFYGYYEGATGVSGDYFDYLDLDGRFFAVIKCDIAGKDVPAALIMIQVATLFRSWFSGWSATEEGLAIETAVCRINGFIEELGFSGRFAAFTLCLFDSFTGETRLCNAGDNRVHWYDASEKKMKTEIPHEAPAAGVLPNFLVDSRGGYRTWTMSLDHGDTLFLYTDGIEEARRKFRDGDRNETVCAEPDGDGRGEHGNHRIGERVEEFGKVRVLGILSAVLNREIWTLRKYHDPDFPEGLAFDFTQGGGTVDEAVMALASAEKLFRLWRPRPPKRGGAEAREWSVHVDRQIDGFLEKFLVDREKNFPPATKRGENPEYVYYTGMSEDPQYDDLAILGIRRT